MSNIGIGQGSAMQQPPAIAIISGLVLGMPLALVVLPALLLLFGVRSQGKPDSEETSERCSFGRGEFIHGLVVLRT